MLFSLPNRAWRHTIYLCSCTLFFGCKNYTYQYYPLPVNQAATANQGEVQVGGCLGTSGATAKSAVAITDKFTVAGQYNGPLNGAAYHSREGEIALGWNTGKTAKGVVYTLYGGYGRGSNYRLDSGATLKDFMGDFQLGFLQFGLASTQGHVGKVKMDGVMAFKFNYIDYNGFKAASPTYTAFTASNFFLDFYFGGSIGGKYWRLEMGEGLVMKTDLKSVNDPKHNLHVFPLSFNVGLQIIINRHYNEEN